MNRMTWTGWQITHYFALILFALSSLLLAPRAHANTVFSEDFESWWGDWYADKGVRQVGAPTAAPIACDVGGGTHCAGTVLDGNYPDNTDSQLISTTVTLPAACGPDPLVLRFRHWFSQYAMTAAVYRSPLMTRRRAGRVG